MLATLVAASGAFAASPGNDAAPPELLAKFSQGAMADVQDIVFAIRKSGLMKFVNWQRVIVIMRLQMSSTDLGS